MSKRRNFNLLIDGVFYGRKWFVRINGKLVPVRWEKLTDEEVYGPDGVPVEPNDWLAGTSGLILLNQVADCGISFVWMPDDDNWVIQVVPKDNRQAVQVTQKGINNLNVGFLYAFLNIMGISLETMKVVTQHDDGE